MNSRLAKLWATKTKDDEWWSSFITSPLAIALNYFVVDIKWLTPNKITAISFITAILAVFFILPGVHQNFITAAMLIHLSHIFDCMDGQMARYRKTTSVAGGYYDKLTDELQVALWFGAIGYAAYSQTQQVLPLILAFTGVVAYAFRGYVKYVSFHSQMVNNKNYLSELTAQEFSAKKDDVAGLNFSLKDNVRWFIREQRKVIYVNEGVFIFMLSFALILESYSINSLTPMLFIFALSQTILAVGRTWFKCREISKLDSKQDIIINSCNKNY
ncbi:MAG: CDP-alcohol phosphatidyltransferase family protein [Endozoicomonadaceae bacterium]|nr:CDP-alcohol phosphatidyltransferase family protein [Endozoicomonadaceae bacterium]